MKRLWIAALCAMLMALALPALADPVVTDGSGDYRPLKPEVTTVEGVTTTTYTKPQGYSYCGVVEATTLKERAAAILTAGVVNEAACPYEITSEIKAALPNILFVKDEAANPPTP